MKVFITSRPDFQITRQILSNKWVQCGLIIATLLIANLVIENLSWQSGPLFHTSMELISTLLAAMIGLMAIVRYYSEKTDLMLLVATAFFGTAFLDAYHTLVTAVFFKQFIPPEYTSLLPWSWVASRWYLSVVLCASAFIWQHNDPLRLTTKRGDVFVYISGTVFTFICLVFFAFSPLPQTYFAGFFIHRPEELATAAVFAIALLGFLRTGNWRSNSIEYWLVVSLVISITTQLIYMPFSHQLFDHEYDIAHLLKISSYFTVFTGLLKNMHQSFRHAKTGEERLRSTMDVVSEGILVVEKTGVIHSTNHAIEQMFGITEDKLIGENFTMLLSLDQDLALNNEQILILANQYLEAGEPNQVLEAKRADNTRFPVNLSVGKFSMDNRLMYVLSFKDITRQCKTEDAIKQKSEELAEQTNTATLIAEDLRQIKSLHQDAIQNIFDGFVLWDSDDRLLMCNDIFKQTYSGLSDIIETGVRFEDFITEAYRRKVLCFANGTMQEAISERIRKHRGSVAAFEEKMVDDRWVRVSERAASGNRIIGIVTDITERKNWAGQIKRLAEIDTLTGLPNRFLFQERLHQALALANRTQAALGIMLLDVDQFKNVNDTLGHRLGDAMLVEAARRILDCARATDTVARLGGDEFAIIATNLKSPLDVQHLAKRITTSLASPYQLENHTIYSSSSIGITVFPQDQGGPEELMRNSDIALYRAKAEGGGAYRLFDEDMNAEIQMRQKTETELRSALKNNEFILAYQPQIDIGTGRLVGIEALVRWQHPERGCLPPGEFIAVAESAGLIIPMSEWILLEACMFNKNLQKCGLADVTVSVNISPLHFNQPGLLQTVKEALKKSSLAAEFLELEITESLALTHTDNIIQMLNQLKKIGVNLAIDDFGTGYSSLSRLKDFPVDRLKIDRSFVSDLSQEIGHQAISKAIVDLGHALGLKVIAEGVELYEHLSLLHTLGCDEAQGYYIAKPLFENDLIAFLHKHGKNARNCAQATKTIPRHATTAS